MIFSYLKRTITFSLLGLFVFIGTAHAKETPSIETAFASTTVKITAMPDAVNVPVEWNFTNHWDLPLIVEKFEESCGCLSAQAKLDNPTAVEPGEVGVIRAAFSAGQLRGVVRKSIYVRFAGHSKSVELIVEAQIPKTVELSATDLVWNGNSKDVSKTVEVTAGTGMDFSITSLTGVSEEQFEITNETITPKRHYRLTITPKVGFTAEPYTLIIRTDSSEPRDKMLAVFLQKSQETPIPALTTGSAIPPQPRPGS